jgi:osmotically inducible protein OsmC
MCLQDSHVEHWSPGLPVIAVLPERTAQYSFSTRFENGIGTNPEELLAAAPAGCFAMALSNQLGQAGVTPRRLDVTATIALEKVGEHHAITKSHVELLAHMPGAQQQAFDTAVGAAETGCPVSKLFWAEISVAACLDATMEYDASPGPRFDEGGTHAASI